MNAQTATINKEIASLLNQSENGNSLFISDVDESLSFYCNLGNGWWMEVHHCFENSPSFHTHVHQTTEDEVACRITSQIAGWQAIKCNVNGVRLDEDGCVSPVSKAIMGKVCEAMGYGIEDGFDDAISEAINLHASSSLKALQNELKSLESTFSRMGGRGVEIADEIDSLRIAISSRNRNQ